LLPQSDNMTIIEIHADELEAMVRTQKKNLSPGSDGITYDILKFIVLCPAETLLRV